MICFGMPTLVELDSLEENVALCRELGLSFVEINKNMPQYISPEIVSEPGIFFTIHLEENLSPAEFNPRVARAYLDTALDAIEEAKARGIPLLNMHMTDGVYISLPEERVYLFSRYYAKYRERMLRFRDACTEAIGDSGIVICLENCGGYQDFQKKGIDLLLESPAFGLTLDIGHSHAAERIDEPFIEERMDRLRHLHIHDALGKRNHLGLGDGEVDIARYLRLAEKKNCRCVLETKTVAALRASVDYLRNLGAVLKI